LASALVQTAGHKTATDADGSFTLRVPNGDYLLLTDSRRVLPYRIIWAKLVHADHDNRLSLDQSSAYFMDVKRTFNRSNTASMHPVDLEYGELQDELFFQQMALCLVASELRIETAVRPYSF